MKFLLTQILLLYKYSAGNNFSLFTGHMSFQIFILVGHLTNWTGHHLLTDNTLKKITEDVLVRCSVIVSDHNVKLAGHFQNLVGQCPMTDCYFQHCKYIISCGGSYRLLDSLFYVLQVIPYTALACRLLIVEALFWRLLLILDLQRLGSSTTLLVVQEQELSFQQQSETR